MVEHRGVIPLALEHLQVFVFVLLFSSNLFIVVERGLHLLIPFPVDTVMCCSEPPAHPPPTLKAKPANPETTATLYTPGILLDTLGLFL